MSGDSSKFFYTSSMLAEQLSVPVSTIRLLVRRGLLAPVGDSARFWQFDDKGLLGARRLIDFMKAGFNTNEIADSIARFRAKFPEQTSVLDFITMTYDKTALVFRLNGEQGIEPRGQQVLVFDTDNTIEVPSPKETEEAEIRVPELDETFDDIYRRFIPGGHSPLIFGKEDLEFIRNIIGHQILVLCESAWNLEQRGRAFEAIELYRTALICGGPDPTICLQLAELLFRIGDLNAARERFYMTIELDRGNIEAQAELGHVLVQLHEEEKAVEVFEKLLLNDPDYTDILYDLGAALFRLAKFQEAEEHLRSYIRQTPVSKKTQEALDMLEKIKNL